VVVQGVGLLGVVPVAGHHGVTTGPDLPVDTGRHGLADRIADLHLGPWVREAGGADLVRGHRRFEQGDAAGGFGEAVALGDGRTTVEVAVQERFWDWG